MVRRGGVAALAAKRVPSPSARTPRKRISPLLERRRVGRQPAAPQARHHRQSADGLVASANTGAGAQLTCPHRGLSESSSAEGPGEFTSSSAQQACGRARIEVLYWRVCWVGPAVSPHNVQYLPAGVELSP